MIGVIGQTSVGDPGGSIVRRDDGKREGREPYSGQPASSSIPGQGAHGQRQQGAVDDTQHLCERQVARDVADPREHFGSVTPARHDAVHCQQAEKDSGPEQKPA